MCRMFGFRSIFQSQVHDSLIHAENALTTQSLKHPDGWGVGYYVEDSPHVIKSTERAMDDHIFQKLSGVVRSKSVIAHIRKATHGKLNILNAHPFQYGPWIFAHNGNLKNFDEVKSQLINLIAPDLRPYLLGTTDSEIIFLIILTNIKKFTGHVVPTNPRFSDLTKAIEASVNSICTFTGKLYGQDDVCPKENHISILLTNGETMCALQGGQPIYYTTHKEQCPERDVCTFFNLSCENISKSGSPINHLIISSEKVKSENVWSPLKRGEIIGVDDKMIFHHSKINIPFT